MASETRPLSLGNSDAKLFAAALCVSFESVLERFISKEQTGFVPGRSILECIVDVEEAMILATIEANHGAAFLFDYSAAFPSLAHTYMWQALASAGIPQFIIHALQGLYGRNDHWLKWQNCTDPVLSVKSGVKQGCPLSPILFIVATEPLLQFLKKHLSPGDTLRGYADDLAIVLQRVWETGPALAGAFTWIEGLTGLSLNAKKCIMVPLWPRKAVSLPLLGESIPLWRDFKVALHAKYLGVVIGPGAADVRWTEVDAKFRARVRTLAGIPLGINLTCIAYKIFAASTLSYVMQVSPIRGSWPQLQDEIGPQLVRGPHRWIPPSWLFDRRSDMPLPSSFVDVGVLHEAVLIRTALTLGPMAPRAAALNKALGADTELLAHPWRAWRSSSMVQLLADARKRSKSFAPHAGQTCSAQTHYYKELIASRPLSVESHVWQRRLGRWGSLVQPAPFRRVLKARAIKTLAELRLLPYPTRWALVRAWLNGWCTARRFQCVAQCYFCRRGEDSIEHISCCPAVRDVGNRRLLLGLEPASPLQFLLLDGCDRGKQVVGRQALFVHAVYRAHNKMRAGGTLACSKDVLWAEVRELVMQHSLFHLLPGARFLS